ncbi:MAG: PaaI family thioesterase [Bacteroidia bacterium]|nr:PaaI family thioesterase [Bacteroidia bacterium]
MIKIKNPFAELGKPHEYHCFGCSPFNEIGLQMEFWEDDDSLIARWQPRRSLEGWIGVLHGGIQATLADEMAGWVVMIKLKTAGVTSSLNVEYLKPVLVSKGEITIIGKVVSTEKRLAKISCVLLDGNGVLCMTAEASYFCFPENIARSKYNYPGIDAFYE